MGYFINELKRRNVVRVGVAYLVVSWLIIQIIETVSGPLSLPGWTVAFFIVLFLAGFPVACLFAWAFELTPEGVKKTEEVDKDESVTAHTGRKLDYAIIATLVIALAYFIWERQQPGGAAIDEPLVVAAEIAGTSIAVLPFVDMSAEQDQEYFSDGISEELLNVLARIPELRVAARTSSFQFKGQNVDIADVAEQLNVEHVLEGSVRKANTRVRITAQLIEADTGFHLWSESYDRELTDIFGIQDEISASIVTALSTTLGLDSTAAPTVSAETNSDAYNAYLLGQHLIKQRTRTTIEAAATHFQRALELDPYYAPAHASLALASYLLTQSRATYGTLTLAEAMVISAPHISRALELDPELADAQAVQGLLLGAQQRHEEALPYFDRALELNPSHNDVRSWYSSTLEFLGRAEDAFELMKTAYELDPLSNLTFNNYAAQLLNRRKTAELGKVVDRFSAIDPPRAATFESMMQDQNRRAGEGVVTLLRAAEAAPENIRIQNFAAIQLKNLGLREEALSIWQNPRAEFIFLEPLDHEGFLVIAEQFYAEDPDSLDFLEMLAWARFAAGDTKSGLELASQYLEQLGDVRRPIDGANLMFVIAAFEDGDSETMQRYLGPLEAQWRSQLDSGIDDARIHWDLAAAMYMQGHTQDALARMKFALSRETMDIDDVYWDFDRLGLDKDPRFVAIRAEYFDYLAAERNKLVTVACGEVGFTVWKPTAETCKSL